MNEKFKNLILEYVHSIGEITLLNLTKNLNVNEKRAIQVLSELEKDGAIVRDFSFVYYDKERLKKFKMDESPDDALIRKNALKKMDKKLEKIARKRMFDNYVKICNYDKNDDVDFADADYDDFEFVFVEDEDLETNVSTAQLEKMKEIIECFKCSNDFVEDGSEYSYDVGITYPNDTEMEFRLFYDDGIILSDNGLTFKYLDSELDDNDSEMAELIKEILNDYPVHRRQTRKGTELCIKIRDKKSAFTCLTFLIVAIERIVHIV